MNPYDIDAYKCLTRLQLKEQDYDSAVETIQSALTQCEETGDLDFLAAMVYKNCENLENATIYLEKEKKN